MRLDQQVPDNCVCLDTGISGFPKGTALEKEPIHTNVTKPPVLNLNYLYSIIV